MRCNRLQLIPDDKYCVFSLLAQTLVLLILKTSNLHIFLISYLNHFKQSSNFIFFNSLQAPLIKIYRNRLKWHNHQRRERAHPPWSLLQDNATTTHPTTHQHHLLLLFLLHGHWLYFLQMNSVKGTIPYSQVVSFSILNI